MNKLLKIKDWYSLEAAASRLTATLEGAVSVPDILELALEEKIALCWFIHLGSGLKVVSSSEEQRRLALQVQATPVNPDVKKQGSWPAFKILQSVDPETNKLTMFSRYAPSSKEVHPLNGPYRLEINEVTKSQLWFYISGKIENVISMDGIIISDDDDNKYQILDMLEGGDIVPTEIFPPLSELGLRRVDLEEFEKKLEEKPQSKTAVSKIDATLSKLVLGMATGAYGYDQKNPSDAVSRIATHVDEIGYTLDKGAIRNRLNQALSEYPIGGNPKN